MLAGDDFRMLLDSAEKVRECVTILYEQRARDERTMLYQATEMLAAARRITVYGEAMLVRLSLPEGRN